MQQVRIAKARAQRRHDHDTELALDPRDPDIVRAKRMQRSTRDKWLDSDQSGR